MLAAIVAGAIVLYAGWIGIALYRLPSVAELADRKTNLTDKPAGSLTPRECAFLTAILPGPQKVYNPYRHLDRVLKRSDMVLRLLREQGVLTEAEYRQALAETPDISGLQRACRGK